MPIFLRNILTGVMPAFCATTVLSSCSTSEATCGDFSRLNVTDASWTYQAHTGTAQNFREVLEPDGDTFTLRITGARDRIVSINEVLERYRCDEQGVWLLGYRSDLSIAGNTEFDREFRTADFDPPILHHPLSPTPGDLFSLAYEGIVESTFFKDGNTLGSQISELADNYEVGVDDEESLTILGESMLTTPVWIKYSEAPQRSYDWLAEGIGPVQDPQGILIDWE